MKDELAKLKKSFARELKAMIEKEIQLQAEENKKLSKVQKYQEKADLLDNDKLVLQTAKKSSSTLRQLNLR